MKSGNTVLGWPGWKVILLRPDSGAWIMLWKKLGRIFDPTQHTLANHCVEFAQSPQALVFDDFLRIYFSTREKDPSGKYLSHISYVDMDKNLQKITRIADHTVIGLGGLGCFDEHGIFPMNVLRNKGRIFAYTCGWSRRVSVSVETSIGFALSEDHGSTFQKMGAGPILTASPDEPFLVGDPFVQIYNDVFHMWYIYGTRWFHPPAAHSAERIYKIGHATSPDGISWQKQGKQIIADRLNADECQALPSVIHFDGKYHCFFCYREAVDFRKNRARSYKIGYAYSNDLIHWTRDDDHVGIGLSESGWDSEMMCYPHVFKCDDKIYLLYNGNDFGKYGFGLAVLENESN